MAGSELYGSGTVPKKGDTKRMLMVKEVLATNSGGGGGGGSGSVLSGVGPPVADPGVSNAVYTDTTNDILYKWYGGSWH